MEWIYTPTEPVKVETKNHLGMPRRTVNYAIETLDEPDESGCHYRHKAVTLDPGVWNYDAIVSALVKAEYPDDRMQAISNNFLRTLIETEIPTDKREEYLAEMQEMQDWRATAKAIAKEILE